MYIPIFLYIFIFLYFPIFLYISLYFLYFHVYSYVPIFLIVQNTQVYSPRLAWLPAKWKCIHEMFPSRHTRSYGFYLIWGSLYVIKLLHIFNFFFENFRPRLTSSSKFRGSVSHDDLKFWFSGNAYRGEHCLLLPFHLSYYIRCIMRFKKIAGTSLNNARKR